MTAWIALAISAALATAGCAGDTLQFGGSGTATNKNDNVVVSGDISGSRQVDSNASVIAVPAGRDVAVFVYSDLRCCNAAFTPATNLPFRSVDFSVSPFDTVELSDLRFADVESVIVSGGAGSFTVNNVSKGDLTVFFLLDAAVADGSIDVGDPVAVLIDDNGTLADVRVGRTVTAEAIDITFDQNFPDGRAEPDIIRSGTSTGSTP